jgi:hypothetical protein
VRCTVAGEAGAGEYERGDVCGGQRFQTEQAVSDPGSQERADQIRIALDGQHGQAPLVAEVGGIVGQHHLHRARHPLLPGQRSSPDLPQVLQQRPQRPSRPRLSVPDSPTIQNEPVHDLQAQRRAIQPAFAQPAAQVGHQPQVTDPRLGGIAQQLQPDTKTRHERRERARDLN